MKPTALITGVAGQDGSYLAELLVGEGYRVIGTIRPGAPREPANLASVASRLALIELDLDDEQAVGAAIAAHAPDEVYNLAAMSFSPDCWKHPRQAGNELGLRVVTLLEAIRQERPRCRFFQAGSSEMFGHATPPPQSADTPLCPASPYGAAKAYAHALSRIYRERHGMHVVNGILFPHESPRRGRHFLTRKVTSHAARIARAGGGEVVLGDLDARRDWSFAGDVARGMWLALQREAADDYVFASGETHSVREFCASAFTRLGLDYRDHVRIDPTLIRVEPGLICGEAARTRALLGWHARTTFTDLVEMMVDADVAALDERKDEA
ncbi:MAG TPA: GDP-mannose 4,6-dehydratase [Planctomycetota bacterium]|nr:GDP-mannose 4,6-dehydratase [Planctomycetota bacterium]